MTTSDAPTRNAHALITTLNRNLSVIGGQTNGLTHADSLLQPQPRGNCMNWVLGHLLLYRQFMLRDLGADALHPEDDLYHYKNGSEPITGDGDGVFPMETLLAGLQASQDRLAALLAEATADGLDQPAPTKSEQTVHDHIAYLIWHETYHIGQTELLRQLSGVNDKVV